jgi:DNA gyrase/topoisomerase IV subunit A
MKPLEPWHIKYVDYGVSTLEATTLLCEASGEPFGMFPDWQKAEYVLDLREENKRLEERVEELEALDTQDLLKEIDDLKDEIQDLSQQISALKQLPA